MRSEALTLGGVEPISVPGAAVATDVAARSRVRRVHAFGETRTVDQWAEVVGISARAIRYRLARGLPPEVAITLPCDVRHVDPQAPCGEPNSWTWECLAFEDDHWAHVFIATHPDGASLESVGAVWGVTREYVRQIEERALAKLAECIRQRGDQALKRWLHRLAESEAASEEL
jgi:hypothetical protein